ncbi:MAG: LysM peptidoglycan-binding domain-containing protein, partial [Chitinophagales bacterium]
MIHIVQAGDTLFQLSKKYGVTIDNLKTTNQLYYNGLWIGQKLTIPIAASTGNSNPTNSTQLKTYTVQRGDSLYKIARKFDIGIAELKKINNLSSNLLSVGQKLKVPGDNSSTSNPDSGSGSNSGSSSNTNNASSSSSLAVYTVQRGDSLYKIATQFKTTTDYIKKINKLSSNTLYVGQQLKVPNQGGNSSIPDSNDSTDDDISIYIVKSGDSLYQIAWLHNTTVESIKQLNGLKSNALNVGQRLKIRGSSPGGGDTKDDPIDVSDKEPTIPTTDVEYEYYRVKSGDSLWSIAQLFNTTTAGIRSLNQLFNNSLSVGQLLKMSKKTTNT